MTVKLQESHKTQVDGKLIDWNGGSRGFSGDSHGKCFLI